MKSSSGFTWFEVLLLLVVLAVVLALLFPAVSGGPGNAPNSSARNDVVQIATAITAFNSEYGHLPSTNAEVQDVGGPVLQALLGSNTTLNPRQIVFLEVVPAKKRKGGMRDGVFVDPWGSPYKMKFDTDGDGTITNVGHAGNVVTNGIMRSVAIWNDPSTHADKPSEAQQKRRSVTSWD